MVTLTHALANSSYSRRPRHPLLIPLNVLPRDPLPPPLSPSNYSSHSLIIETKMPAAYNVHLAAPAVKTTNSIRPDNSTCIPYWKVERFPGGFPMRANIHSYTCGRHSIFCYCSGASRRQSGGHSDVASSCGVDLCGLLLLTILLRVSST